MQSLIEKLAADIGIPLTTVRGWRCRGRVSHQHRLPLADAARQRGIDLPAAAFDDFGLVRPKGGHAGAPAAVVAVAEQDAGVKMNERLRPSIANCDRGLS